MLFVIALVWAINACCIASAARACRLPLISLLLWSALLGPLAWIALALRLRHLPLGRVAQLPSPLRQVCLGFSWLGLASLCIAQLAYCVRASGKQHSVFDSDTPSDVI